MPENNEAALATAPDADAALPAPEPPESGPPELEPPELEPPEFEPPAPVPPAPIPPAPELPVPEPAGAPPEPVSVPLEKGGFGLEGDVAFEFSGAGAGFLGPEDVELDADEGLSGLDDVEFGLSAADAGPWGPVPVEFEGVGTKSGHALRKS